MILIPRSLPLFIISVILVINRMSAILVTQRSLVLALTKVVFFISPVFVLKSIKLVIFVQIMVRIMPAF